MKRSLTIYPAIDLKAGQCVRLLHGEMDQATIYNENPADQARQFETLGFETLHIVDLDGAFSGRSENRDAVAAILKATSARCQLGGGVRTMEAVEGWLEAGLTRIILGTAAVKDPEFVTAACKAYPGAIAIGIDARGGRVKTDGWAGDTGHTALEIGKKYEDQGVSAVVYTDIGRDGALTGVNVEETAALAEGLAIPVIASGGVASDSEIELLRAAHDNIEGVIIGRALYDGRVDPSQAIRVARAQ